MSLDRIPYRLLNGRQTTGVGTSSLALPTLDSKLAWAVEAGFSGLEIWASGRSSDLYAPLILPPDRVRLRDALAPFVSVAVRAPTQETYDVSLVSPSASIRRASITEIWSACRLVEALGGGVVTVRAGSAPDWVPEQQQHVHLAESLQALDRVAGSHNAVIGIEFVTARERMARLPLLNVLNLSHTGLTLSTRPELFGSRAEASDVVNRRMFDFIRDNARHLVHLHLQDSDEETDGLPLGRGRVDFRGLAAALSRADYNGMVCLQMDSQHYGLQAMLESKQAWEQAATEAQEEP